MKCLKMFGVLFFLTHGVYTDLGDIFEAFPEVWLHGSRVLRLRQDLEKFIIRQEVETWEGVAFRLQIFT